jgi:hypothetical protein
LLRDDQEHLLWEVLTMKRTAAQTWTWAGDDEIPELLCATAGLKNPTIDSPRSFGYDAFSKQYGECHSTRGTSFRDS